MADAQAAQTLFVATIKQIEQLAETLGLTHRTVGSRFELSDGYSVDWTEPGAVPKTLEYLVQQGIAPLQRVSANNQIGIKRHRAARQQHQDRSALFWGKEGRQVSTRRIPRTSKPSTRQNVLGLFDHEDEA